MIQAAIRPQQLWSDLMTLAQIGALRRGGCDRLSLTDADRDARNLFRHWCTEAGFAVTVDAMGNIFARREGADPSLPPVLAGSHLDTQQPGGKFDGPLGVLAALEALRAIDRAGITTRRAIEVVNWTNEEGARFAPGLMGSAVFAGTLPLEDAYASTDRAGKRFGDELTRIGYRGAAACGGRAVDSYIELHIEQGPDLQNAGKTIGAVTNSQYNLFLRIECTGENGHVQGTLLPAQRNALLGAARLIAEIDRIGHAHDADGAGAAAATLDVWPNNRINIPHRAVFDAGLRHPDQAGIEAMEKALNAAMARIGGESGLGFRVLTRSLRTPFHFDAGMTAATEALAAEAGLSSMRLMTRPGHDAFNLSTLCPTALIFIPCRDGISHSELEWVTPEHCAAGAGIVLGHMLRRAGTA